MLLVGVGAGGGEHILQKLLPAAASAHHVRPQLLYGLGGVLAVTAAHADDRLRVFPAAAAEHGPVFLVRHGGDGAGIDDIAVAGVLKGGDVVPLLGQQALHGLSLILVGFAAQGIKSKFHMCKTANFGMKRLGKSSEPHSCVFFYPPI